MPLLDDRRRRLVLVGEPIWRVEEIVDLLESGQFGENNRALLEARGAKQTPAVVAAENKDRQLSYKLIARIKDSTVTQVTKERAEWIRETSRAGTWLQSESGTWYQQK